MSPVVSHVGRTTLSDQDILPWPVSAQGSAVFLSGRDLLVGWHRLPGFPQPTKEAEDEESVLVRLFEPLVDLGGGWDGYGALAPRSHSLEVAAGFVRELLEVRQSGQTSFPLPDVMASVAGGVLLEWQSDAVDLLLDIQPDGPITVYVRDGDSEEEGELAVLRDSALEAISRLASSV